MNENLFVEFPLWGMFALTLVMVLVAFNVGVFLGEKHRLLAEKEDRSPISSIVAATLGLLAFLLAFTFGLAANKFDERRALVVDEANAIGTTYLRAGYLPDPYQTQVHNLLKAYVSVRLGALETGSLTEGVNQSEALQDALWQQATAIANAYPNSVAIGLFIQSLNEVIDLHAKRVNVGMRIRIPSIIWGALYFVTALAIGSLGYQFGLTHVRYMGITLLLILTFSTVILLIIDLDRPQEGMIRVSQQALMDLREKWKKEDRHFQKDPVVNHSPSKTLG